MQTDHNRNILCQHRCTRTTFCYYTGVREQLHLCQLNTGPGVLSKSVNSLRRCQSCSVVCTVVAHIKPVTCQLSGVTLNPSSRSLRSYYTPNAKSIPNCNVSFANGELHHAYGHDITTTNNNTHISIPP